MGDSLEKKFRRLQKSSGTYFRYGDRIYKVKTIKMPKGKIVVRKGRAYVLQKVKAKRQT